MTWRHAPAREGSNLLSFQSARRHSPPQTLCSQYNHPDAHDATRETGPEIRRLSEYIPKVRAATIADSTCRRNAVAATGVFRGKYNSCRVTSVFVSM